MTKVTFKIGRFQYSTEVQTMKQAHELGSLYGALPEKCDVCKSANIYLSHKSPKGNDYYTLHCGDCGAELTFHQKKEGGMYVKWDEKMEKFNGGNEAVKIVKEAVEEIPF